MVGDDVRCSATAKSTGRRCRRHALAGAAVCAKHGGAAPQVARRARARLLDAFAHRALWRMGAGPRPEPTTLELAAKLDLLRRRAPRWWRAVDEQTAWRLSRERAR
jgi:hypothetical protein